jgi:cyclin T
MSKWLWNEEFYASRTPSRKDGISLIVENRSRAKTVLFIEELGLELQCNRIVVATACVFFHRFFCLQSFKQHNRFVIGATSLFLASKVEEEQFKVKSIVSVWMGLRRRRGEEVAENEPKEVTNKILLAERILLQTLCFDMQIVHPFGPLIDMIKNLKAYIDPERRVELRQTAISFINDSMRSPLCLCHEPKFIATAAFFLATLHMGILPVNPNPRNLADQSWFELIEESVVEATLQRVCGEMLDVYVDGSPTNAFAKPKKKREEGTGGSSSSSSGGSGDKAKVSVSTEMTGTKAGELWSKLNSGQHAGPLGQMAKHAADSDADGGAATVGEDDSGKGGDGDVSKGEAVPPPPPEESPAPPPPVDETPPPPPPPSDSPDGAPSAKRAKLG